MLLFDCFHALGFCTPLAFPLRCFSGKDQSCSSNTPRVQGRSGLRGGPGRAGNELLSSVLFPSAEHTLGLQHHFSSDSLSTPTQNSAPIYFSYGQASVTTLPRFEEMFDTIVSSSSTFNCWSENLLSHIFKLVSFDIQVSFKFPLVWRQNQAPSFPGNA